jgi:alpha,alpha-trehalose phosphorylase
MPLPGPFQMHFVVDGSSINPSSMKHLKTTRTYDLKEGLTRRISMYEDALGHRYQVSELVFAHAVSLNKIFVDIDIISIDRDVDLDLIHVIEMPYIQETKIRDPRIAYEKNHLNYLEATYTNQVVHYVYETMDKNFKGSFETECNTSFNYDIHGDTITGYSKKALLKGKPVHITLKTKYHSNHVNLDDVSHGFLDIDEEKRLHQKALQTFWYHQHFMLNNENILQTLHYHLYHLYFAGGVMDELSIAAKGLSGEGYEGHYFWDTEMYMLPYLIMHHPERARHILRHRLIHLEKAKQEARLLGVGFGAKIPWRSIDGNELSPYFPAGSSQIHINSDIAYAYISYVETTGDEQILKDGGFELLCELGLYILHYGYFDHEGFHLPLVTGPDEYTPLVHDNYYTHKLVRFHFSYILTHYEKFQNDLSSPLDQDTLDTILQARDSIVLLYDKTLNIHLQDRNHLHRKPLPKGILPNHGLPLMLKKHPHYIYRHQVLKQADSIAVDVILNDYDTYFESSFHHYLNITSHDSSLSKCMYGIGAYHIGNSKLGDTYFEDVLMLDIKDEKNHTKNGLHLANAGGAYLVFLRGLLGIYTIHGLSISPAKDSIHEEISYTFLYQQQPIQIHVQTNTITIIVNKPLDVKIYHKLYHIQDTLTLERER